MTDVFEKQSRFMVAANHIKEGETYSMKSAKLYTDLLLNRNDGEAIELYREVYKLDQDMAKTVKETCDVIVVAAGILVAILGEEMAREAYGLVNYNNMLKVEGDVEYREDGKVLKSEKSMQEMKEILMGKLNGLVEHAKELREKSERLQEVVDAA